MVFETSQPLNPNSKLVFFQSCSDSYLCVTVWSGSVGANLAEHITYVLGRCESKLKLTNLHFPRIPGD